MDSNSQDLGIGKRRQVFKRLDKESVDLYRSVGTSISLFGESRPLREAGKSIVILCHEIEELKGELEAAQLEVSQLKKRNGGRRYPSLRD